MTKQGCLFSVLKIYTEVLANKIWQGKEIKIYQLEIGTNFPGRVKKLGDTDRDQNQIGRSKFLLQAFLSPLRASNWQSLMGIHLTKEKVIGREFQPWCVFLSM